MLKTGGPKAFQIRDHARYQTVGVRCNHGEVRDLSASGMRFRVRGKPGFARGNLQRFVVESGGQRLQLTGRIVWIRREGLLSRDHQVGVHFVNLKPAHQRAIEQFAVNGFIEPDAPKPSKPRASVSVEIPDLYAIMGLARDASQEEISATYRRLAKELHPDVAAAPDAAEQFAVVGKAYRVLHDPESRARYDRMLAEAA